MRALTSRARISVAQRNRYETRYGAVMPGSIGSACRSDYPSGRIVVVSWLYIALLALAVAVVVGAEWPRLGARLEKSVGADARRRRDREKRKASLRVVQTTDADDFAASVERDLANLPTIEETDRR
jgi:hypothetical protein